MYCSNARVLVDLRDEIGAIWRLLPADGKAQAFMSHMLVVGVGVVDIASGGVDFSEVVDLLAGADGGLPAGELAGVGVEGDGAFRVIIFESLGFGEAEGDLGGGVVGEVLLDVLVRDY